MLRPQSLNGVLESVAGLGPWPWVLPPCGPRKLPLVGVPPCLYLPAHLLTHPPCPQGTSLISLKVLVMLKAANRWSAGKFCLK